MSTQSIIKPTPNLIAPHFHYSCEVVHLAEDDAEGVLVSELVPAGQVLASFPPGERKHESLEIGKNTRWYGDSIVAEVAGYPRCVNKRIEHTITFADTMEIEPLFEVSPDAMSVTLSLHPILAGCRSLISEDIHVLLKAQGIICGINEALLAELPTLLVKHAGEFVKMVIARGVPVEESIDSHLHFNMQIGPISGVMQQNDVIEFRERRAMVAVEKGQVIATKIPAVQGRSGMTIYGREIPARKAVDFRTLLLNDVIFSRVTNEIQATSSGTLSIVRNNIIKVLPSQTIHSDVDSTTGSITSKNNLTIQGSVQPGFHIDAEGDVNISEGIYNGEVRCDGNLVVKAGVTGKRSRLKVGGDIDLNFIEQGRAQCEGIFVLRSQAYYASIEAGENVRCHPQSKVMGGTILAQRNVSLGDVGGENSRPVEIAAGVLPERLLQYEERQMEINRIQEEIIDYLEKFSGSSFSSEIRRMEKKIAGLKLLQLRLNMIPGSGIWSRTAPPTQEDIAHIAKYKVKDYSTERAIDIQTVTIDVKGTIVANSMLRIGNRTLTLEKAMTMQRFKLSDNGKRIVAVTLKR
ncbi:DUF342 domain-containing protein [Desulforhopalus vacuolatus]|uniref:DUF342 domain-containing protein n=1 Tax=Desulforhopalus vacuolatus TaxID=40414 RepID=UPI0019659744|nr:FapA family protein [Desulforhopalus vacuolatus]MBM9520718.1 DUF342 domain-containing protein [Desulforhopalus vacuolatus]